VEASNTNQLLPKSCTALTSRQQTLHYARPACASLALAFALAASPLKAQDYDGEGWVSRLSQITVTATRTPIVIQDAPLTVSVKTDEQIADELITDIRDLVRFEPGVSVQRQPARFTAALGATGRAGNDGFTVRGIGGNRVLIQVDGVRVPDGFSFGAQSAGRGDYVDLGLVKSVEILRGPASALYGSDGLSGAVSFITSDPADILQGGNSIGGLVRSAYSSADTEFSETAIIAGKASDWSAMLAYTRRDYHEPDNQGVLGTSGGLGATRTAPNPQDGKSNAVLARLVYDPASGHKLRLTGEYLDTHLFTDVLSGRSATVETLTGRDTGKRKRASLDWSWDGDGLIHFARAALYWQTGNDVQFTDEDRTPAADRERLNTFENRVFGASADARRDVATGQIKHRLVFGGDISMTTQQGLRDGVVPPFGEVFPTRAFPKTDFTRVGFFVGDEIAIADGAVTLYPALRFDHFKLTPQKDPLLPTFVAARQSGSRVSPKLGLAWKVTNDVRLFGNYATGFKAPEPGQVNQFFENLAFGYTSLPNPNLGPERSESFEGGVRLTSNAVSLDLTAFTANYKDFISQEVVGGAGTAANPTQFQFINLSRVKVKGAEARFEGRTSNGITGTLSLSYATGITTRPSGQVPLSTIEPLKLVAGVGYRQKQSRFGGQITATHGAQKTLSQTIGVCSATCFRPDGFTVLDATAFVKFGNAITLRAGIFNITNESYATWNDVRGLNDTSTVTAAYTQPGRNASASLSFKF
jgi:hemoglobin/transferrin/lactoferrin receptor protein